jgi:hypothetical protein
MDPNIELAAIPHPDPRVRRLGFDLSDPYVEQCWGAVLGPTGVAILRRAPVLWSHSEPALVPAAELAQSLGLGTSHDTNSRFSRAVERLVSFRVAVWVDEGTSLGIYTELPPLGPRSLERAPSWTRETHERLLSARLDNLAATVTAPNPRVASITARLDQLQQRAPEQPTTALQR